MVDDGYILSAISKRKTHERYKENTPHPRRPVQSKGIQSKGIIWLCEQQVDIAYRKA